MIKRSGREVPKPGEDNWGTRGQGPELQRSGCRKECNTGKLCHCPTAVLGWKESLNSLERLGDGVLARAEGF